MKKLTIILALGLAALLVAFTGCSSSKRGPGFAGNFNCNSAEDIDWDGEFVIAFSGDCEISGCADVIVEQSGFSLTVTLEDEGLEGADLVLTGTVDCDGHFIVTRQFVEEFTEGDDTIRIVWRVTVSGDLDFGFGTYSITADIYVNGVLDDEDDCTGTWETGCLASPGDGVSMLEGAKNSFLPVN